jgi:hypothetical protein
MVHSRRFLPDKVVSRPYLALPLSNITPGETNAKVPESLHFKRVQAIGQPQGFISRLNTALCHPWPSKQARVKEVLT